MPARHAFWFLLLVKALLWGVSLQPCHATEERTRRVFGVVVNSGGLPIANAQVDVLSLRRQPPDSPLAGSTFVEVLGLATSDSEGVFSIEVQDEDDSSEIALEAIGYAEGLGLRIEYLDVSSLKNGITLSLPAERRISCMFLWGNRLRVPDVNLKLVSVRSTRDGDDNTYPFTTVPEGVNAWPSITKSNANGVVELVGVGDETECVVELDDIRFAKQRWTIPSESMHAVFLVNPPRSVQGVVVDAASRQPVETSIAFTFWKSRELLSKELVATDASGRFELKPPVCDEMSIRVVAPDDNYGDLNRNICWPSGTLIQRMTLPLYRSETSPVDGTTADGQMSEKIGRDIPSATVLYTSPSKVLTAPQRGTIIFSGNVRARGQNEAENGLFLVDVESGKWKSLGGDGWQFPRISADAKRLVGTSLAGELLVTLLQDDSSTRLIPDGICTTALFTPIFDGVVIANYSTPAIKHYYGEEYWGLESETWIVGPQGKKISRLAVPPLFNVTDVSTDGILALNRDTHCHETGAQVFVASYDGTEFRAVARKKFHYYWYPLFSPDGKMLLTKHLLATGGHCTTNIVSLDGRTEREIAVPLPFESEYHCWSPEGESIAIVAIGESNGRRESKIFVADTQGSAIREVSLDGVEFFRAESIAWTAKKASEFRNLNIR